MSLWEVYPEDGPTRRRVMQVRLPAGLGHSGIVGLKAMVCMYVCMYIYENLMV